MKIFLDATAIVLSTDDAVNLSRQISMAKNALSVTGQSLDNYPELLSLADQIERIKTIALKRRSDRETSMSRRRRA